MEPSGRDAVLRCFAWVDGHADVWAAFRDASALRAIVGGLCEPWRQEGVTHVVGIESRGFVVGGAVAVGLCAGFVAIRKEGTGLLPGSKVRTTAEPDYRGNCHDLRMQRLPEGSRALLVDDWAELGSQASAARQLVEACDATFLGVALMVDQLNAEVRRRLGRVTSLVTAEELGPSK